MAKNRENKHSILSTNVENMGHITLNMSHIMFLGRIFLLRNIKAEKDEHGRT